MYIYRPPTTAQELPAGNGAGWIGILAVAAVAVLAVMFFRK